MYATVDNFSLETYNASVLIATTPDDYEIRFIRSILYTRILEIWGYRFTVIIHYLHILYGHPFHTKIRSKSTQGLLSECNLGNWRGSFVCECSTFSTPVSV